MTVKLFRVHNNTAMAPTECGKWLLLEKTTFRIIHYHINPSHLLVNGYQVAQHRNGNVISWASEKDRCTHMANVHPTFFSCYITLRFGNINSGPQGFYDPGSPTIISIAPVRGELAVLYGQNGRPTIFKRYRGRLYVAGKLVSVNCPVWSAPCDRLINTFGSSIVFEDDNRIRVLRNDGSREVPTVLDLVDGYRLNENAKFQDPKVDWWARVRLARLLHA